MSKALSNPAMALWIILISTPFLWNVGSKYEGDLFPVVTQVEIIESNVIKEGTLVSVKFIKKRPCEFVGISWYDKYNIRYGIEFEPNANLSPVSRPIGHQVSEPWLIKGMASLKDSRAIVSHRCHPFWITYSQFYP